jgi:hypothetical protein
VVVDFADQVRVALVDAAVQDSNLDAIATVPRPRRNGLDLGLANSDAETATGN